jgi:hypothetical protein
MGVLMLFIDGIGVGVDDPDINPFARRGIRRLRALAGRDPGEDCAFRPIDATLGVAGIPQSATGQTTLFTGVNAAALLGRHHVGLPGPSLWPLLTRESLFAELIEAGRRPTFANAYTASHLRAERPRFGATTRMMLGAGLRPRTIEDDDPRDAALSHDYTGEWMRRRGIPCRKRNAREAASVLAGLLEDHDLVLYEYFLTDLAGHRGSAAQRDEQARRVEALVDAAVATVGLDSHCVVVVSDHGNLEEAHHDRHTVNPVPLIAWGRGASTLVDSVERLDSFKSGTGRLLSD